MTEKNPRWEGERAWATEQLEEARATEEEARLTLKLLEIWFEGFESDLNDGSVWKSLEFFVELAHGRSLPDPVEDPERPDVWIQAKRGIVLIGDRVRVKPDAFTPRDPADRHHFNGMGGRVVGLRPNICRVKLDKGDPSLPFYQFDFESLELLVGAR